MKNTKTTKATTVTKVQATKAVKATKAQATKVAKVDESKKIKGTPGQGNHFYKGFPRALAYDILIKARSHTLSVSKFLDKIEKLPGVKSRKQATGIVAKMVNKPGQDGQRNGQIAHFV